MAFVINVSKRYYLLPHTISGAWSQLSNDSNKQYLFVGQNTQQIHDNLYISDRLSKDAVVSIDLF